VWAPFKHDTEYFAPEKSFMFNLVVDDLDGVLAQVKEGGAEVVEKIEEMEYGRFGWFFDPEGNKVELWEPGD
jgi:predicted enzyme related to lactoylglutathione lyase